MAARLTPSPPREWPMRNTLDRSARGADLTMAGALERAEPAQSAHFARCSRTSEDRAWAPPSSAAKSWPLMPFAEMETVT
jgi:hypothetical protein